MKTLSQVLGPRKTAVLSVSLQETTSHALKLMAQHHVGAVLVVKNGHAIGVATEQDCARGSRVEDVMSSVVCAPQQMTVREAMAIMAERRLSYLPVLDDHKDVIGVVSIGMLSQETLAA